MLTCTTHPRYKGIKEPRETKRYPDGCPACWWVYYFRRAEENGFLGWQEVNYDVFDKEAVGVGIIDRAEKERPIEEVKKSYEDFIVVKMNL